MRAGRHDDLGRHAGRLRALALRVTVAILLLVVGFGLY